MARLVDIDVRCTLEDYAAVAHLVPAVTALKTEAARVAPRFAGRTVWMVNSTEKGGGVAEMLPTMVALLREVGFATEWVVLESDAPEFFHLTKRIHNLIHGAGTPGFSTGDRALYEAVSAQNAAWLSKRMKAGDVLVVHDPQPMPMAASIREHLDVQAIWRCHIGLDEQTPETRDVWEFLAPYGTPYHRAVFSAPEYIPGFLAGRSTVIYPAIDPLASKSRNLNLHKTVGVLVNAGLAVPPAPVVRPPFPVLAQRLQSDGRWAPAVLPEDIGLLARPIVTQVSRWDRLKGWTHLMEGFAELKRRLRANALQHPDTLHERRLELVRLVLAGPAPGAVEDDPEQREVLEELTAQYLALHPSIQSDIAVVLLPMDDPSQNALMVNALQRAASIVVQNSLREGFGLTVTEAMWKRTPILTNSRACGPRQQVRDRVDGCLIPDPEDPAAIADAIDAMLGDRHGRALWGRNAQRRVHDQFLVFSQLAAWIHLLEGLE